MTHVREAKRGNNEDGDEDPEEEALKRRLYRYKYVRKIDDKLPTVDQLRNKIKQQEDDAYFIEHGVEPDRTSKRAARFTHGSGVFTKQITSVAELDRSLTA